MNDLVKKFISFIIAFVLLFRVFSISVSAMFTAPAAYSIEVFVEALLTAMGVSQSDINSMSFSEKEQAIVNCLDYNGGNVSSSDLLYLLSGQAEADMYKNFMDLYNSPEAQAAKDVINYYIRDWFIDHFIDYAELSKFLVGTPSIDLLGYGAKAELRNHGNTEWDLAGWVGDYIILYNDGTVEIYNAQQFTGADQLIGSINPVRGLNFDMYYFYGDIRYEDGTQVPSDEIDIVLPDEDTVVGVLPDGREVTIGELIGTDGVIDGDPVKPYWDVFDPDAIIELIKDIIDGLDREHSKVDSSTLSDIVSDTVGDTIGDTSLELDGLENLLLPTSIIHVFPFCLPFDFVQGMYLFEAAPEIPHFDLELNIPPVLNVPSQTWKFEIDLERFETLAKITRWLSLISFVYTLILLTGKIVKGAGA